MNVNGETITFYALLSFSFFMVFFLLYLPSVCSLICTSLSRVRFFCVFDCIGSFLSQFFSAALASSTKENEEVYTLLVMMTTRKRIFNICARVKKMRNVGLFLPLSLSLSLFCSGFSEKSCKEKIRKKERKKKREREREKMIARCLNVLSIKIDIVFQ